jgi:hypothetical protein
MVERSSFRSHGTRDFFTHRRQIVPTGKSLAVALESTGHRLTKI